MKINEKLNLILIAAGLANWRHKTNCCSNKKDGYHFISLLFTLLASRRLPSAALLMPRHSSLSPQP
jgi:hypothetical protein